MKIRDILRKFPPGTVLRVYIRDFGGPSCIGNCRVERRTIRHLGSGYTWGEFAWWFERDNRYRPVIVRALPVLMHRVWEIRIGEDETCLAAVSIVREASLRQEIADGRRRMTLVRMYYIHTDLVAQLEAVDRYDAYLKGQEPDKKERRLGRAGRN